METKGLRSLLVAALLAITGAAQGITNASLADASCDFDTPIPGAKVGALAFGAETPFEVSNSHSGIDLLGGAGTPVHASESGRVVLMGDWPDQVGGKWENSIWIAHTCGAEVLYTQYVHLDEESITLNPIVKVGDWVEKGQLVGVVGRIGESGFGNADHVHFGVTAIDPRTIHTVEDLKQVKWLNPSEYLGYADGTTGEEGATSSQIQNSVQAALEIAEINKVQIPMLWWEEWYTKLLTSMVFQVFSQLLLLITSLTLLLYYGFTFVFRPRQTPRREVTMVGVVADLRRAIRILTAPIRITEMTFSRVLTILSPILSVFAILVIAKIPLFPLPSVTKGYVQSQTSKAPGVFVLAASEIGYDPELLWAFYKAAVPRDENGSPVESGENGFVFPPSVAASIPFGETNQNEWGNIDPTTPGPWGYHIAWYAVEERWPVSWYQSVVLGMKISNEAKLQREGLVAIANWLNTRTDLPQRIGRFISPLEIMGSSAGAVGRTQILPSYFAPGQLCANSPMDPWNNPSSVADCTTRHLITRGCWGSWIATGDIWSSLCGYNPGAWDDPKSAWYWETLGQRATQIKTLENKYGFLGNAWDEEGRIQNTQADEGWNSVLSAAVMYTSDAKGSTQKNVPLQLFLLRSLKIAYAIAATKGENGYVWSVSGNQPEQPITSKQAGTIDPSVILGLPIGQNLEQQTIQVLYSIVRMTTTPLFTESEFVEYGIMP